MSTPLPAPWTTHNKQNVCANIPTALHDTLPHTTGEFPLDITLLTPGEHTYTITITSTDGQTASDTIEFSRPPFLAANCSVAGTVLSCNTNNQPDSFFCLIDMSTGVSCSALFELQTVNIQVGEHVMRIFVRDEFFQQVNVDITFTIVSDLQIQCQEEGSDLTTGRVDCGSTGGIGSVSFTCSIDNTVAEVCKLNNCVNSITESMYSFPQVRVSQ